MSSVVVIYAAATGQVRVNDAFRVFEWRKRTEDDAPRVTSRLHLATGVIRIRFQLKKCDVLTVRHLYFIQRMGFVIVSNRWHSICPVRVDAVFYAVKHSQTDPGIRDASTGNVTTGILQKSATSVAL